MNFNARIDGQTRRAGMDTPDETPFAAATGHPARRLDTWTIAAPTPIDWARKLYETAHLPLAGDKTAGLPFCAAQAAPRSEHQG
jgi:hypothetical protein